MSGKPKKLSMNGSGERPVEILIEHNGDFVSLGERFRAIAGDGYQRCPDGVDGGGWVRQRGE